ncbi:MAG: orotidine-5'-phosphate decarboxylase, partial [Candidatus Omnitrophica bacterium]|nr:orotidine-5'-phosphate decarboxylase [Candidatus Omnitrophota bacterium]
MKKEEYENKLPWDKLIVALDLEDKSSIAEVVNSLYVQRVKFKIGSIAFTKYGPDFLKTFIDKGADVFLDLKLYDIPNTMKRTAAVIAEMGCWAFTVHLQAGKDALTEVKDEVFKTSERLGIRKPLILGVTVLTSQVSDCKSVMDLAKIGNEVKLDGVISSPQESAVIKEQYPNLKVITPGIRINSQGLGDQKRVTTARYALTEGKADFVVVGRPIIKEKDYFNAALRVLEA